MALVVAMARAGVAKMAREGKNGVARVMLACDL
jgi:hypothetical protein